MEEFSFNRSDAEWHFKISISESDWNAIVDNVADHGDFGVQFTSCLGGLSYKFDNSEVLDSIEYASHEQIPLDSELEKFTYLNWDEVSSFWLDSIEIEVIASLKSELERLGLLGGEGTQNSKCEKCHRDFPISLFDMHLCHPTGPSVSEALQGSSDELSKIEISNHENEILVRYYAIQDQQKEIDADRKLLLGELFDKFSDYQFLTVNGKIVGKVVKSEYLAIDIDLLRYKYPEVYSACLVKIRHQRYIKRPTNLI